MSGANWVGMKVKTYFCGLAIVKLRVRFSAAYIVGGGIVLGVLGRIGDAARLKTDIWKRAARVHTW